MNERHTSEDGTDSRDADISVLIVDSDQQRCAKIGQKLATEKSYFDVRTETSVEDGVTRTETEPIDIVVGVEPAEGTTGISVLRNIRASNLHLPFVLMAESVGAETAQTVLDHDGRWLQTNGETAAMIPVLADIIEEEQTIARGITSELKETEARYETLTQMLPDILFVTDYDSRMLFANDELERQTGLTVDDFQMDQEANPFIHPKDQERLAAAIGEFAESERTISEPIDNRFIDKNGDVHWFTSRIGKVTYQGEPALQFLTQDITSRRGEDESSDERWHRSLLDRTQRLASIGGYEFDCRTENLLLTDGMYDLLEFETKEDLTADALINRFEETGREQARAAFERAVTDGEPFELDTKLVTETETVKWVRFQGDPLPKTGDDVERVRGALVDITDRKEYEQQLEAVKTRLELALEETDTGVWEWNLDTDEVLWDETSERLFGYETGEFPEDFAGFADRVPEDDLQRVQEQIDHAIETGDQYRADFRVRPPDGDRRWIQARGVVEYDDGEPERLLGIQTDITDQKERERELRQFKRAVEATGHVVVITDRDGTIEYVNPAFEEITGYSADEVIGETPVILNSGEMSEEYFEDLWTTILAGETWSEPLINRRKSGELYHASQTIAPIVDDGEVIAFVAIQTDITERKEREEELRKREQEIERAHEQLRQIVDLIPDPLFVKNIDDEVLLSNEANADLLGSTPDEVEGKPEPEIMPDVENYEQYRQRDIEVIKTGNSTTFEEELSDSDGDTRIFKITRLPFKTSSTEEDAVLGYARDVTDLKEYEQELRETKRTLEQSNEKLDQFAGIVSHDLRNPLNVIKSRAELLRSEAPAEHVEPIERNVERMETMIDDLLTLSRAGESVDDPEPVSLTTVVADSWMADSRDDIELEVDISDDVEVEADGDRLRNVFENLFRNASEHNDPPVTIRVGTLSGETGSVSGFFIADNGAGIPESHREEVFEYGYTTNTDGTGFGLSIVEEIIEAHGWTISITESDAGGVRFEVHMTGQN